jgi:hypothetical protein
MDNVDGWKILHACNHRETQGVEEPFSTYHKNDKPYEKRLE